MALLHIKSLPASIQGQPWFWRTVRQSGEVAPGEEHTIRTA